jgi:hypothetical protein
MSKAAVAHFEAIKEKYPDLSEIKTSQDEVDSLLSFFNANTIVARHQWRRLYSQCGERTEIPGATPSQYCQEWQASGGSSIETDDDEEFYTFIFNTRDTPYDEVRIQTIFDRYFVVNEEEE